MLVDSEDRAIKTILLDGNYRLVSDRRIVVFNNNYYHEIYYSKSGYKHLSVWEVPSSEILSKYNNAMDRYNGIMRLSYRWKPTIKSTLQEFRIIKKGYLYPTVGNDYNARLHCKDIIGLLNNDKIKPLDPITDKVGIKKVDDLISEFPSLNLYKVTDVCYLVTNEYGCYGLIYKNTTPRYTHWVYSKWIKLLINGGRDNGF